MQLVVVSPVLELFTNATVCEVSEPVKRLSLEIDSRL